MYRKIRIGLGTWSFGDEFSDYSDEMAYNILENDPDWQSDPKKAKIVSKLELYPLKMSYFQNSSQ
nr:MAG TPA: aldo-keto reductase [Caudoviricetes sp.]